MTSAIYYGPRRGVCDGGGDLGSDYSRNDGSDNSHRLTADKKNQNHDKISKHDTRDESRWGDVNDYDCDFEHDYDYDDQDGRGKNSHKRYSNDGYDFFMEEYQIYCANVAAKRALAKAEAEKQLQLLMSNFVG